MPLATARLRLTLLALLAVMLVGAALRFQAVALTEVDTPIRADARIYYLSAYNLARWQVFSRAEPGPQAPPPDAYAPPAYPWLIRAFLVFPPTQGMLLAITTVQALLGSLTIALVFLLFRQFAGDGAALAAAALTALAPHLVSLATYLLTETLFTFLLIGGIAALAMAHRRGDQRLALLGGLTLGLSGLTRATTEYLPLWMLATAWLLPARDAGRRLALYAGAAALTPILAWKLRNLAVLGSLGDPTLMIKTLHHGMYPGFLFQGDPRTLGYPYAFDPFSAHADSLRVVLAELWQRASAAPLEYLRWYLLGKPVMLLSWNLIDGAGDIFEYPVKASPYFDHGLFVASRALLWWLHLPLSVAGVTAALIAWLRPAWLGIAPACRAAAGVAGMVVAYFLLLHIIGAPFPRYGVPLRPLVYGYGAFGLAALAARALQGRRSAGT